MLEITWARRASSDIKSILLYFAPFFFLADPADVPGRPAMVRAHRYTPLHWACQKGHAHTVQALLAAGASVHVVRVEPDLFDLCQDRRVGCCLAKTSWKILAAFFEERSWSFRGRPVVLAKRKRSRLSGVFHPFSSLAVCPLPAWWASQRQQNQQGISMCFCM